MNQIAQPISTSPAVQSQENNHRKYHITPSVDITSNEEGYLLRAELPGVDKEGLEITVDNGELTIIGHRKFPQVAGDVVYKEIRPYDFHRVYELDPSIDTTKIHARLDQGILTLTLPKAETIKVQKVTVE